jgi:hypothetical protein
LAAQTGQLAIADPVMEMTAGPDQVEPQESAGNNIVEEMDLLQAEFTMGAGPTGGVARGDYSAGQPNQAIGQVEPEELAQAGEEQLAGESETEYILAFGAQISDQEAAGISDPVVYKNDYDSCEINRPIMLFKAAPLKPDEYQTACTQLHDAYRDVMTALK